jgi:hypothetical protein
MGLHAWLAAATLAQMKVIGGRRRRRQQPSPSLEQCGEDLRDDGFGACQSPFLGSELIAFPSPLDDPSTLVGPAGLSSWTYLRYLRDGDPRSTAILSNKPYQLEKRPFQQPEISLTRFTWLLETVRLSLQSKENSRCPKSSSLLKRQPRQ